MSGKEKILKDEIIAVGRRLYETGLAVAKSGNISALLSEGSILITASGTSLGDLKEGDIVKIDLATNTPEGNVPASSELPLHSLVYKNFPAKVVIHCHPPLINGYFAVCDSLQALTFETKFYLGEVPVIPQDTPTVTDPASVIEALKSNSLVVLKNHGTVAIGDKFSEALDITEALEEAVKSAAIAKLFNKQAFDALDTALKDSLKKDGGAYPMFSLRHIEAIVELVNSDEFIARKGKELDLTLKLAIKLEGSSAVYKFNFEKGRVVKLDTDSEAPFVISASGDIWEQVFLGKLDPFVAVTQGRMKLEGQIGQLSKWYVPFSRLFELFKQVPFK